MPTWPISVIGRSSLLCKSDKLSTDEVRVRISTSYELIISLVQHRDFKCACRDMNRPAPYLLSCNPLLMYHLTHLHKSILPVKREHCTRGIHSIHMYIHQINPKKMISFSRKRLEPPFFSLLCFTSLNFIKFPDLTWVLEGLYRKLSRWTPDHLLHLTGPLPQS